MSFPLENKWKFIELFLNYTDKFEYPKGSDLLLAFIFVFYIFLTRKQFSQNSLIVLFVGALYAPLLVKVEAHFSLMIFLCFIYKI